MYVVVAIIVISCCCYDSSFFLLLFCSVLGVVAIVVVVVFYVVMLLSKLVAGAKRVGPKSGTSSGQNQGGSYVSKCVNYGVFVFCSLLFVEKTL